MIVAQSTVDFLFHTIQDLVSDELDVDTSSQEEFASLPSHKKIIFRKDGELIIISISQANENPPSQK